jgi:hypothetical protein
MPASTGDVVGGGYQSYGGAYGSGYGCDGCNGGCDDQCGHCCLDWLANPSRGFRPPVTAPVYRDAVVYDRYWPDHWYGEPGFGLRPQFPQVYLPTDTTQLGFYYQRVPQWMPNPGMYPRPPIPSQWHRRMPYGQYADMHVPRCCHETACNCNADAGTQGILAQGLIPATQYQSAPQPMPQSVPQPAPRSVPPAQPPVPPLSPAASPPPLPSASTQSAMPQQAGSEASQHWLLEDIMSFSRSDHSGASQYAAPSMTSSVQPQQMPQSYQSPQAQVPAVAQPAVSATYQQEAPHRWLLDDIRSYSRGERRDPQGQSTVNPAGMSGVSPESAPQVQPAAAPQAMAPSGQMNYQDASQQYSPPQRHWLLDSLRNNSAGEAPK